MPDTGEVRASSSARVSLASSGAERIMRPQRANVREGGGGGGDGEEEAVVLTSSNPAIF